MTIKFKATTGPIVVSITGLNGMFFSLMAAAFLCGLRDLHSKKVSVATNTWGATA